jgi:uncharacterized protein YeaC (DUF1315 family)
MKTIRRWMMMEPDGAGGASGTPATPPAAPPETTPATPPATPPAAPPAAPATPPAPSTPPAAATPPAQPPATGEPVSLLAGDDATATPEPAIAPEVLEQLLAAVDLKFKPEGSDQEIELDRDGLKAVLPEILKLNPKATKEQVSAIAKANAAYQVAQMKAENERNKVVMGQMVAKTKETFGNDLPAVVGLAKKGGSALFGKELWAELAAVPAFSNDHRVIAALAHFGRSISPDRGPGGGSGGGAEKDFFTRWTNPPAT